MNHVMNISPVAYKMDQISGTAETSRAIPAYPQGQMPISAAQNFAVVESSRTEDTERSSVQEDFASTIKPGGNDRPGGNHRPGGNDRTAHAVRRRDTHRDVYREQRNTLTEDPTKETNKEQKAMESLYHDIFARK